MKFPEIWILNEKKLWLWLDFSAASCSRHFIQNDWEKGFWRVMTPPPYCLLSKLTGRGYVC